MVTYDDKLKLYVDIWRDVVGYGATADEAERNAEWAMREIRAKARREEPGPVMRYSLLTGRMEIRPG